MKICIGCDHGGYLLKEEIKQYFQSKYEMIDCGCFSLDRVDYPLYAKEVCLKVASKECDYGILICTTGIGMSIVANKFEGIRAALVNSIDAATMTRQHNDSNVICIGAKYTPFDQAIKEIDVFVNEEFTMGRHTDRVNMIKEIEKRK